MFICDFVSYWSLGNKKTNRWIRVPFRLLASVPPIVIGLLVRELGVIMDYAGSTGFMIGFIVPGLLFVQSQRTAQQRGFSLLTCYTSWASIPSLAILVALMGVYLLYYVLGHLIFG